MDAGYFVECGDVLTNKLGITDPAELQEREYQITTAKTLDVLNQDPPSVLDFDYLLSLHGALFGDIYDFAGQVRTVNISKPDSSVPFAYADYIKPYSDRIFSELKTRHYLTSLEKPEFVTGLAWLSSELNALHPFREGNGRTIRLFLDQICANAGYVIDFNLAAREEILAADRTAFAGDLSPLVALYTKIVSVIWTKQQKSAELPSNRQSLISA